MNSSTITEQHYIECATCNKYSKFYCNTCHQRMCEECREGHIRENENRNLQVVHYKDRLKQLPKENCLFHPPMLLEKFCYECPVPICSECLTTDHNGHQVLDLEVVYNICLQQCQEEVVSIRDILIPQCEEEVKSLEKSKVDVKKKIAELRLSMNQRADSVLDDNNAKLNEMEASLVDEKEKQLKKVKDYISYLNNLIDDCYSDLSSCKLTEVIRYNNKNSNVILVRFPEIIESELPNFEESGDIAKEIEQIFCHIKPFAEGKVSREVKNIKKSLQQFNSKSAQKLSMEHCSFLIKTQTIRIPGLNGLSHLSPAVPSGMYWASGDDKYVIQFDLQGNILQKVKTGNQMKGYHSITKEDNLIYTDYKEKAIYKINMDMTTTTLITSEDWEPWSIFSSPINGNILVGMKKEKKWKIARYTSDGIKLQDIQKNVNGEDLYSSVSFITENINGDICTSDYIGEKVQVVTGSGEYLFSYSGSDEMSGFSPSGICTDVLGNILVCCSYISFNLRSSLRYEPPGTGPIPKYGIHLLDQDGHFLDFLLDSYSVISKLYAVCVDNQNNLIIGRADSPTICVYKYLKGKCALRKKTVKEVYVEHWGTRV